MLEQSTLIAPLRGEERRPLLQFDEDEGVDRRRETPQHVPVLARERHGVGRQFRIELHG
jgi:hypothetical protein